MNGSILGMTRSEVRRKFDEIVEFSGVDKYIDTPVKWYSSGMYIRLGFAVAAHLEPEVMIVDEVLAVGDAEFQKRCLGRMGQVSREGRTVLFVSHNMQAVRSLCERAILLDHGRVLAEGDTHSVVRNYLASVEPLDAGRRRWDDPDTRPGDDTCRLVEVRVGDDIDTAGSTVLSSRPIPVVIELDVLERDPAMVVAFDLVSADGTIVFRSYTTDAGESLGIATTLGRKALRCEIPADLLNAGRYWLNVRAHLRGVDPNLNAPSVLHFDVSADHGDSYFMEARHGRPGVLAPILPWELVEPESTAEEMVPPSGAASARG
jgi:lipopolysaccharide transport system ATP-binding protein